MLGKGSAKEAQPNSLTLRRCPWGRQGERVGRRETAGLNHVRRCCRYAGKPAQGPDPEDSMGRRAAMTNAGVMEG